MAGTPYWRERKFVTSSSVRKVRFLLNLNRLFQLLRGNDLLFDEKVTQPLRHTSISYPRGGIFPDSVADIPRKALLFVGRGMQLIRVDTNCQRKRVTVPVTLVLGPDGDSCFKEAPSLESAPNDCL